MSLALKPETGRFNADRVTTLAAPAEQSPAELSGYHSCLFHIHEAPIKRSDITTQVLCTFTQSLQAHANAVL
jgi:hypothetical protein